MTPSLMLSCPDDLTPEEREWVLLALIDIRWKGCDPFESFPHRPAINHKIMLNFMVRQTHNTLYDFNGHLYLRRALIRSHCDISTETFVVSRLNPDGA